MRGKGKQGSDKVQYIREEKKKGDWIVESRESEGGEREDNVNNR